jgi:hypothetical protein
VNTALDRKRRRSGRAGVSASSSRDPAVRGSAIATTCGVPPAVGTAGMSRPRPTAVHCDAAERMAERHVETGRTCERAEHPQGLGKQNASALCLEFGKKAPSCSMSSAFGAVTRDRSVPVGGAEESSPASFLPASRSSRDVVEGLALRRKSTVASCHGGVSRAAAAGDRSQRASGA